MDEREIRHRRAQGVLHRRETPVGNGAGGLNLRFRHSLAAEVVVPEDRENRDADARQRADQAPSRVVHRLYAARVEVVTSQQDGVEWGLLVNGRDGLRQDLRPVAGVARDGETQGGRAEGERGFGDGGGRDCGEENEDADGERGHEDTKCRMRRESRLFSFSA